MTRDGDISGGWRSNLRGLVACLQDGIDPDRGTCLQGCGENAFRGRWGVYLQEVGVYLQGVGSKPQGDGEWGLPT